MNIFKSIKNFYNEMNPATLSGAIDIIVIKRPNGDLVSTPFHVRFGKIHLLRPKQNHVNIFVNEKFINGLYMKVGDNGDAFFVLETENPVPSYLLTSPIQTPSDPNDDESVEYFDLDAEEDQNFPPETPTTPQDIVGRSSIDSNTSKSYEESSKLDFYQENGYNSDGDYKIDMKSYQEGEIPLDNELYESGWSWRLGRLESKSEKIIINQNGMVDIPESYLPCALPSRQQISEYKYPSISQFEIELSLCGDQIQQDLLSIYESNELSQVFESKKISYDQFCENSLLLTNPNLVTRINGVIYKSHVSMPLLMSLVVFNKPLTDTCFKKILADVVLEKEKKKKGWSWVPSFGLYSRQPSTNTNQETKSPTLAPIAAPKQEIEQKPNYAKTLTLTSDQLKTLNLEYGKNEIKFTVENGNKKSSCSAMIYLWNHDEKIVISDIDGTITKSDALGHVLTAFGRDWTHPGVAKLFSDIVANGYKIIYLTARAIGQSNYTREFLRSVEQSEQKNKTKLPQGPCICSPDPLFSALHREVWKKTPHEFKIAVLKDFASLFPSNPFYAGFGNRESDATSYKQVGVPVQRIFTINPQSEIKLELINTFKSSYANLSDIADQMFPPVKENAGNQIVEEFTDFNYWRVDHPSIQLELEIEEDRLGEDEAVVSSGYPFYEIKESK